MNRKFFKTAFILTGMICVSNAFGIDQPVLFDTEGAGESKAIDLWGLDTAWLSGWNVDRGVRYMGQPQVDLIRFSFTGDTSISNGNLTGSGITEFNDRMNIVDTYCDAHTALYLNNDTDNWSSNPYLGSGGVDAGLWAELIDVTTRECEAAGRTVLAVAPFNEPDYGTWQGDKTRLADVCWQLRNTYGTNFAGINIYGASTLNNDQANPWYDTLNNYGGIDYLEEGCTHQLAGDFWHYADFYTSIEANGDLGVNDELHNVMEAMVGAEYGMDVGIWWGTAERARGEFVKASDGDRLAYAENRGNWTAASVYRAPGAVRMVKGFVGESERQALPGTYRFFSKDRPVFYDGHGPQRAYEVTTTGDPTYQSSAHRNAERVVNITWGADVQPAIAGRYYIVNRKSLKLMEIASASTNNGVNIQQYAYSSGDLTQQWDVNPLPNTSGGDYSYYTINNAYGGGAADVDGLWASANVKQWTNGAIENGQWYLEYVGGGWFYIRNRLSGLYLEVSSGSTANGANIGQYSLYTPDPTHQQWRLVPVGAAPADTSAPGQVTGVAAAANPASVQLSWNASAASDLEGYDILRSNTSGSGYEMVARSVATNAYTDYTANQTVPYYYIIKAVDHSYNRSANSATVNATPTGSPALVAHYAFEDDANDSSVNGNNGVENGTTSYAAGGVGTSCLKLTGTGYVELPAEMVNHDQLTIAAWVNWNGGDANQRIFDFGNLTDEYLFLTPSNGSGMHFGITTNNYWNEETLDADALPVAQWTHVAVTLSNNVATLYVNGTNAASSTSFTLMPSDFNPVLNYIGRSQFSADPLFNGEIDDFRVYNHALSAAEVYALTAVPVANLPGVNEVVSLNVESYGTIPNGPGNTAGVVDADYWNDTWRDDGVYGSGLNGHTSVNLQNDSGSATTIDATFACNDTWNITGNIDPGADDDGTHNRRLIQGYLNNGGGGTTSISLAQIPYASYDLYVYFSADVAGREGSITDGTTTYYFSTLGSPSVPMPSGNAVLAQSTDTTDNVVDAAANYVVFSGLSGSSKTVTCNIPDYGGIAGFQIVYNGASLPPVAATPAGLATASTNEQIALSWDAASNATSYKVKYSLTDGGPYTVVNNPVTTNYLHTGLSNGTTYYYVVSALGDGGKSADSDQTSAVPSAAIVPEEYVFADHAVVGGTNLSLTVTNSMLGHWYGLLQTDTLTPPDWTTNVVEAGTGSNIAFGIPISGVDSNRFFKLEVQRQ